MISRSHKFPLRSEFLSFRRRARRFLSPHYALYSLPHPRTSRLGIIIPQTCLKTASARNRFKRSLYSTLWPHLEPLHLDLVLLCRRPFLPSSLLSLPLLSPLKPKP